MNGVGRNELKPRLVVQLRALRGPCGRGRWNPAPSETSAPLIPTSSREKSAEVARARDVEIEAVGSVPYLVARLGDGVFVDRAGAFGSVNWRHFETPKGTPIPDGLSIIKDKFNKKQQATHNSLSPTYTMTQRQVMMLLDQLAHNAIEQTEKGANGGG